MVPLPASQIIAKKRIGSMDGKPVYAITGSGGINVIATVGAGGVDDILAMGSHIALARHIASRREGVSLDGLGKSAFDARCLDPGLVQHWVDVSDYARDYFRTR